MGVAEVLAGLRAQLRGTRQVHLPAGRGNAARRRGRRREDDGRTRARWTTRAATRSSACTSPRACATGVLGYRPGPAMASADKLKITVHGRQTHGAAPWLRRGPDRHRGAGGARACRPSSAADRPDARARGGDHRRHPRRRAREHHPRQRGDARHHPHLRRGDARRHPRARHHPGRGHQPRLARRLQGVHRQELPGDRQRPGAHRGHAADAAARGRRRACMLVPKVTGSEDFSFFQRVVPGLFVFIGVTPSRQEPEAGGAQPFAALLRRRSARCCWACARWPTWPATTWSAEARPAGAAPQSSGG